MMTPDEFGRELDTYSIHISRYSHAVDMNHTEDIKPALTAADQSADLLMTAYREAYERAQAANNAALKAQVGAYTPIVPSLQAEDYKMITRLINEVRQIAENGYLPDGDHVNAPAAMWFEEWADTLEGICLFRMSRDTEAATNDCREAGYNDA